jgi:type I restriction enzyme S subunit
MNELNPREAGRMNESALPELPEGWVWTRLGDIAEKIVDGSHNPPPKQDFGIPMLSAQNILNNKIIFSEYRYITLEDYKKEIIRTPIEAGDVLLTIVGTIGRSAVVKVNIPQFAVQRSVALIKTKITPEYLSLLFQSPFHSSNFLKIAKGTAQKGVYLNQLEVLPIPLPPLMEQHRIVTKTEELFTKLDAGISKLKKTQAQLKRYRQSVLKAAFEGKLVSQDPKDEAAEKLLDSILFEHRTKWEADLRTKGKDPKKVKYVEPQAPNFEGLPHLPESWKWVSVSWEAILAYNDGAFKRGPFGSALTKSIFVESGYKVYEQYCPINDDCSFGRYYITPEKFDELKTFEVRAGDYLVSCSGVTLGRITRVPQEFEKGIINQALLRVRINDRIISHLYFLYLFRSPFFQKLLFDNSTGTAIPNVKGVKELKAIPIPLPPFAEQRRIVAELERRLSVADEVARTVEHSLAQAERLRQSILKKAFEGRLVAQDASDEPAGVLLERIKQQKQLSNQTNKTTRRKVNGNKSG